MGSGRAWSAGGGQIFVYLCNSSFNHRWEGTSDGLPRYLTHIHLLQKLLCLFHILHQEILNHIDNILPHKSLTELFKSSRRPSLSFACPSRTQSLLKVSLEERSQGGVTLGLLLQVIGNESAFRKGSFLAVHVPASSGANSFLDSLRYWFRT